MKICDNGVVRNMTSEEETIASNLPDPEAMPLSADEALNIILGGAE